MRNTIRGMIRNHLKYRDRISKLKSKGFIFKKIKGAYWIYHPVRGSVYSMKRTAIRDMSDAKFNGLIKFEKYWWRLG